MWLCWSLSQLLCYMVVRCPHTLTLTASAQVHATQKDKEDCVQVYNDAHTFFNGSWDAALAAGYTCAHPTRWPWSKACAAQQAVLLS